MLQSADEQSKATTRCLCECSRLRRSWGAIDKESRRQTGDKKRFAVIEFEMVFTLLCESVATFRSFFSRFGNRVPRIKSSPIQIN